MLAIDVIAQIARLPAKNRIARRDEERREVMAREVGARVVEHHHGLFAAAMVEDAAGMGAILSLQADIGLLCPLWQTEPVRPHQV